MISYASKAYEKFVNLILMKVFYKNIKTFPNIKKWLLVSIKMNSFHATMEMKCKQAHESNSIHQIITSTI